MMEVSKDNPYPSDSKKIVNDIQTKKKRLLEIENEQNKLNKDLSESLEKIADIKFKIANKVESLSEDAFINLAAKNKVYVDLFNKVKKLKLSDKISSEEFKKMENKLSKAEEEKFEAKQKSEELSDKAKQFRRDANLALEKFQNRLKSRSGDL